MRLLKEYGKEEYTTTVGGEGANKKAEDSEILLKEPCKQRV